MARNMALAHAEVASVTIMDDADIARWWPASKRADAAADPRDRRRLQGRARAERVVRQPALGRRVLTKDRSRHRRRHAGRAARAGAAQHRRARRRGSARRARAAARDARARKMPPEELRGYTITLSNFGTFGGRYANPIVLPPTVAILGAGRVRDAVVAADGARPCTGVAAVVDVRSPRSHGRRGQSLPRAPCSRISRRA